MQTPYYSRDPRYKSPFGAVTAGTSVRFKLYLPIDCHKAWLVHHKDGCPAHWQDLWRTDEGDETGFWWEGVFTPTETGLYFYHFYFDTPYGHNPLTKGEGGAAVLNPNGPAWQLTVYGADFDTPDWLKGGIMYQIFPDRFWNSGTPKQNLPADRYYYSTFEGEPAFNIDDNPRRLNNDYWGGDLKGIQEKLPYLKELGVTCLYLNPIFEAHANHRYNTADYKKIDPLLGSEADFTALCDSAHALGMKVILDGVFSHTGSDSVYFNKEGRYPPVGAINTPDSPYRSWYTFVQYPDKYHSWWGFPTLPEVNETDPDYLDFIAGENGVLTYWMERGADGWRLDVADELPDLFLERLRQRVKTYNPQALVIGEVWEDATTKYSYGKRRPYLMGKQLDSVMNYPFANGVIDFIRNGNAAAFMEGVMTVTENYPAPALHTAMNHLGTHDTKRLITALVGEEEQGRDRLWQSGIKLNQSQLEQGEALVKLAVLLQYTLPGVPCVYYGDELGMEGYRDPFNRAPMAWNHPPLPDLTHWYQQLGNWRKELTVLQQGTLLPYYAQGNTVAYLRTDGTKTLLTAVNRGETPVSLPLPDTCHNPTCLLGEIKDNHLILPPVSGGLITY